MIDLTAVTKQYGTTVAVQEVSLSIPAEQTTVLIGPSGSGKSTLLRLMIGLTRPDEGHVTVDDTPLTAATAPSLRRRMGYVIQEGGLFPHLTGHGNVALMARHLGWDSTRIDARIAELTDLVQLSPDRLDQYPTELSGGQRQRVSLMRALMLDPDVLLLDEPLGALDPMIRSDLQDDLRAIFRRLGKTVVFVTHNIGEAAFFGDRVVLLQQGQMEQTGTMQALIDDPASPFVTNFIQAQRAPMEQLEAGNRE
ncbi:MAG: ATP-binding cassette domain-containing protein [Salinibacter sp.]